MYELGMFAPYDEDVMKGRVDRKKLHCTRLASTALQQLCQDSKIAALTARGVNGHS
jgi:hypothetical protein